MKRPKTFRRTRGFEVPTRLFDFESSAFFAEGEAWSRQRRLTAPSFSHKNVKLMSGAISSEIDDYILRLKAVADGREIQFDNETFIFTIRVISAVAFGGLSQEAHEYFFTSKLSDDFHSLFQFIIARILFPVPDFIWRRTPNFFMEDVARIANKRMSDYCLSVIKRAQKHIAG
jgi:cytochrome P450